MTIDYQIRDEKLEYDIDREAPKFLPRHQAKFVSMNISLVKKYYYLINKK